MKKSLAVIVGIIILVLFVGGSAVAGNNIKIFVNGKQAISDQQPFIANGRTMVPLRFVAEALGAEVGWNDNTQTVTINQQFKRFTDEDIRATQILLIKHDISIVKHLEYDELFSAYNNLVACTIAMSTNNAAEGTLRFNKANEQLNKALAYELAAKELSSFLTEHEDTSYLINSLDVYTSIRNDLLSIVNDLSTEWTADDLNVKFSLINPTLQSLKQPSADDLINSTDAISDYLKKFE